MFKNPLVSIIIPVYNGSNFMKQAIDSALAQTYKNIEIIVINDGSKDDGKTEKIALSYGEKICYYNKENGGCASALNFGIEKMNGEFFSWLSHDDVYFEDKIEKEINAIFDNQLDPKKTIVSCNGILIDENNNIINHSIQKDFGKYEGLAMFERLLFGRSVNGCGLLIPKNIIKQTGDFKSEYKYILDWEYWLRTSLEDNILFRMTDNLVKNRIHKGQVTVTHKDLHKQEINRCVKSFIEQLKINPSNNQKYLFDLYKYAYINNLNIKIDKNYLTGNKIKLFFKKIKRKSLKSLKKIYWKIKR